MKGKIGKEKKKRYLMRRHIRNSYWKSESVTILTNMTEYLKNEAINNRFRNDKWKELVIWFYTSVEDKLFSGNNRTMASSVNRRQSEKSHFIIIIV